MVLAVNLNLNVFYFLDKGKVQPKYEKQKQFIALMQSYITMQIVLVLRCTSVSRCAHLHCTEIEAEISETDHLKTWAYKIKIICLASNRGMLENMFVFVFFFV